MASGLCTRRQPQPREGVGFNVREIESLIEHRIAKRPKVIHAGHSESGDEVWVPGAVRHKPIKGDADLGYNSGQVRLWCEVYPGIAHDGRFVGRFGRRGRRRASAACACLRHQWLDPGASSFCGVFGLKPTYGRLTRARTFPFVSSLDHVGPLARSTEDLAIAYDAMQGPDPNDPACAERAAELVAPLIGRGTDALTIVVAASYFRAGAGQEAFAAIDRVAAALGVNRHRNPGSRSRTRRRICDHCRGGRGAAS